MEMDDPQKRANEAGIRLVAIEIETAVSLLSSIARICDPRERAKCLKEARATLALASRVATLIEIPDSDGDANSKRIRELNDRLDQLWAMHRENPGRRAKGAIGAGRPDGGALMASGERIFQRRGTS